MLRQILAILTFLVFSFSSFANNPSGLSAKNVTVNFFSYPYGVVRTGSLNPSHARFVLETDVNINMQAMYYNNQLFWDLVFAKPERVNFTLFSFQVPEDNEKLLDQYHLVFGRDESDNITDLFLPLAFDVAPISNPESIKTLSFDYQWLTGVPNLTLSGKVAQGLDKLKHYVNVEELYIPDCQLDISSLDFLSPFSKLRHLQIPSVDRTKIVSGSFDTLESLESIRFMGKPDKQTLKELQQLTNLKRLEIVDILNDYSDRKKAENLLKKIFPKTTIAVLPPTNFEPDIPEKFKQHLDELFSL